MSYPSKQATLAKYARKAPYLTSEEEHALATRWVHNKDLNALHKLTEAHIRMVIAHSLRYSGYGLSMSDLIQEGHLGLMEAASRFDPTREVRFATYATWWIKASLQDFILKNWSVVRGGTSSGQKTLFFSLRRIRAEIERANPHLNNSELSALICKRTGRKQEDIQRMTARLSGPDSSLNQPLYDEEQGGEQQDRLVCPSPSPEAITTKRIDRERRRNQLEAAMMTLNQRERHIIKMRHLMDDSPTLAKLGKNLGISKERVRQIECKALDKLRAATR
ncbi:RNA polymerase factor sigma-32 [Polycladidibacter stylochi]|uniref:RNA polymerase factor sigma-32 n=1 Tax=Polycladidibacter stylochi TaxID=1807766 RepID=UPI0008339C76|nr:RNA polymerase factor sigma-32 [Pseudovibrio stylochi]